MKGGKLWWLVGLAIALVVVFALAPLASSDPDGLEKVAEDKGFAEKAEDPRYEWLPDYTIPGIDDEYWSTVLSGSIGVGIVFVLLVAFGAGLRMMRRAREDRAAGSISTPG